MIQKHITKPLLIILLLTLSSLILSDQSKTYTLIFGDEEYKFDDLKIGETIEIILEGNPTTGFSWYIEKAINDFEVVSPINAVSVEDYEAFTGVYTEDEPASDIDGGSGYFSFIFKVVAGGSEQVDIVYKKIWEDVEPTSTITISFNAIENNCHEINGSNRGRDNHHTRNKHHFLKSNN